jgi:hypothetical protein
VKGMTLNKKFEAQNKKKVNAPTPPKLSQTIVLQLFTYKLVWICQDQQKYKDMSNRN